ncbi:MAG: DUF3801 domain-containing protein [Bifidobacteriales bacterium]|nr:DUF3801 domain-containing protein [Bifidobacteriales bacterium]
MPAEDQAQDYALRVFEGGARVVLELSGRGVAWSLGRLGAGVKLARGRMHEARHNSGSVSVRDLKRTREPLKVVEVEAGRERSLARQLKRAGIAFHIERDRKTGSVYLHFAGRDADEVRHAVEKVVVGLDIAARQYEHEHVQDQSETAERNEKEDRQQASHNQSEEHRSEETQRRENAKEARHPREPWNPESAGNPCFDFRTVAWDADASIIAANLERESIPFRQETVIDGLQRFFYPRGEAQKVAGLIDRLADRTPGLDWDRFFPPDRLQEKTKPQQSIKPKTARPGTGRGDDAKTDSPHHVKTKAETMHEIRTRAAERVQASARTTPKPMKTKTR